MRKLPHTAAKDLLEIIKRRCERASTLVTSNPPVEDWGKLLGDTAAVSAMLDRATGTGNHSWSLTTGRLFLVANTNAFAGYVIVSGALT